MTKAPGCHHSTWQQPAGRRNSANAHVHVGHVARTLKRRRAKDTKSAKERTDSALAATTASWTPLEREATGRGAPAPVTEQVTERARLAPASARLAAPRTPRGRADQSCRCLGQRIQPLGGRFGWERPRPRREGAGAAVDDADPAWERVDPAPRAPDMACRPADSSENEARGRDKWRRGGLGVRGREGG